VERVAALNDHEGRVSFSDGCAHVTEEVRKMEFAMNWDTVKGDWKQFKGKVREQWGKLTDDELEKIQGRRDQLTGAIQKRYGIAKEEAEKQVKAFEEKCGACETAASGARSTASTMKHW
jgi:uncharacterized protein YjbJ (UPF0337 family)